MVIQNNANDSKSEGGIKHNMHHGLKTMEKEPYIEGGTPIQVIFGSETGQTQHKIESESMGWYGNCGVSF